MKVKHWQGYGCVEMKKISQKVKNGIKTVVVRVSGNHEYGLERNDTYDIHRWICKRLAKDCKDYSDIIDMQLNDRYEKIDGIDTEVCDYTITYCVE